jgi:para-nitrobenzyl esterase
VNGVGPASADGSPAGPDDVTDAGAGGDRAEMPEGAPIVVTTDGPVRGQSAGQSDVFLGIPYAAPPSGALRWRPPIAPPPWQAPRDVTSYGSQCPQLDSQTQMAVGDEDCLYLNVWAPHATAPPRPVLVFVHGGGHFQGAASEQQNGVRLYDGQYLSEHGDVVVVTLNYRLGALGFLAQPLLTKEALSATTGNYGILDQLAALKWVKANIASFGGDPSRVLLFGESAGAFDTCVHLASPLSAGLFNRALMESGECVAGTLVDDEANGAKVVSAVGCGSAADVLGCMRAVSAKNLVQLAPGSLGSGQGFKYQPTIDGYVLADSPQKILSAGQGNRVPLVVGSNADEGAFFLAQVPIPDTAAYWTALVAAYGSANATSVLSHYPAAAYPTPKAAAIAVYTDDIFTCHARRIARAAQAGGFSPVRRYFFTHVLESGPLSALGSFHGLEVPFVFHNFPFGVSAGETTLSDALVGYWTRFATTGDPNGSAGPAWPGYASDTDDFLGLDETITSGQGVRTSKCDFWDTLP